MDKVSIIVPVYNTGAYLKECLDSLSAQTFKNIEIILVNDGSSDNSLQICQTYAANDNRFKIIDKQNQGLSAARNSGLDNATGAYVGFVDSDDIVDVTFVEELYNSIIREGSDISFCKFTRFTNTERIDAAEIMLRPYDSATDNLAEKFYFPFLDNSIEHNVMGSACRILVRRDMLSCNNIMFAKIGTIEDSLFMTQVLSVAKKASVVDKHLYFYRTVNSSLSRQKYNKRFVYDITNFLKSYAPIINNAKLSDEDKDNLIEFATTKWYAWLVYNELNCGSRKQFIKNVKDARKNEVFDNVMTHRSVKRYSSHCSGMSKLKFLVFRNNLLSLLYFINTLQNK